MAEIRVNTTGTLKLFDADDSHSASIKAGTISADVASITLESGDQIVFRYKIQPRDLD